MAHNMLLSLPHEVLHCILLNVPPHELANLFCCRALYQFIKADHLLFKKLYLRYFDDPSHVSKGDAVRWEAELYDLVRVQRILESNNESIKDITSDWIEKKIEYLLQRAPPQSAYSKNVNFLARYIRPDTLNSGRLCSQSTLFTWATEALIRQMSRSPPYGIIELDPGAEQEVDTGINEVDTEEEEEDEEGSEMNGATVDSSAETNDPTDNNLEHLGLRQTRSRTHAARLRSANPALPKPSAHEVEQRQRSAKLHCLFGVPVQNYSVLHVGRIRQSMPAFMLHSIAPYARSVVYDLRQHTQQSGWGPFRADRSDKVDWEKVEAIMLILHHNMVRYARTIDSVNERALPAWDEPFVGTAPYSYISRKVGIPMQPRLPLEEQDPFNVTGTWNRVVCFLDYSELFAFNFEGHYPPSTQPRPPLDTEEAIRIITMRLAISKIDQPNEFTGPSTVPVVHFTGMSSSAQSLWDPNANSKIRGHVRLTPKGDVRWTTWSIFAGEERWRSEGVQVGGIQSARGVFGYWFDKDFDEHGPAGPTAFWKDYDGVRMPNMSRGARLSAQADFQSLHMPMY